MGFSSGFHGISCWKSKVPSGFDGVSIRESGRLALPTVWELGVAGMETMGETACRPGVSCWFLKGSLGMET